MCEERQYFRKMIWENKIVISFSIYDLELKIEKFLYYRWFLYELLKARDDWVLREERRAEREWKESGDSDVKAVESERRAKNEPIIGFMCA